MRARGHTNRAVPSVTSTFTFSTARAPPCRTVSTAMSTVSPETTAATMTAATKENFSMFMLLSSAIDSSQRKYSTTHPNRQTAFRTSASLSGKRPAEARRFISPCAEALSP